MTDEARTLDWLYAHDLTKLFAGIASQARRIFGIKAEQVHVDTTSFSVSGDYARAEVTAAEPAVIAITYGYSRDHREDLKQWMLALATTHNGDVPLFLQPLDGNSSDKVSLLAAVMVIQKQLREADGEASVYVADNGIYSESNMRQLNQAGVQWVSRVSETLTEAKTLLQEGSQTWQQSKDGTMHWFTRDMALREAERTMGRGAHASFLPTRPADSAATGEQSAGHLGAKVLASLQSALRL